MDQKHDDPIRSAGDASRAGLAETQQRHETTHGEHESHPKRGVEQPGLNAETLAEQHRNEVPHLKR